MIPFKLEIPKETYTNKYVRIPNSLLDRINKAIEDKEDINFTKFVVLACYYALDNLEDNKKYLSLGKSNS